MAVKDSLPKAYIELPWDDETSVLIPAARSDMERVRREGPAMVERYSDAGKLTPEEEDALVRESLAFFCGEDVGERLYTMALEYIGRGLPGSECAEQMVAVVELVAQAWEDHLTEDAERRGRIAARYLGDGDDAI